MVIDHLRFIMPVSTTFELWCYSIGRLAYPLFLFLMAHYFYRSKDLLQPSSDLRYIKNLMLYAVLSELPYRLYFKDTQSLNIFPSLILSFILLYACVRQPQYAFLYFISPSIIIYILDQTNFSIQYSWVGCYAVLAFYMAFIHKKYQYLAIFSAILLNLYLIFALAQ